MTEESVRPEPGALRSAWPLVRRDELVGSVVDALRSASVLVDGFAGAGKTAVAQLTARRLATDGWLVRRSTATHAGRHAPYSTLAPIVDLTDGPPSLASLVRALTGDGTEPGLLVVDDAQWLDPGSTRMVEALAGRDDVRILATVRTGEPGADEWDALADDGLFRRITPAAADRELVGRIAATALGGRVAPTLVDELTERSGGNLLYLRELVLAGVESGTIALRVGRWVATSELPTGGVGVAIARRIRSLDPDETMALAALALVEPVPADDVARLPLGDHLGSLERRGFVVTDPAGSVRLTHPLLADGARSAISASERRRTLDETTEDLLAKHDVFDSDLALRLTTLRVANGLFVPLDVARATAARAFSLLDHGLAIELGRAALRLDPHDVEANLAVGAALSAQFAGADAERHLRLALDHARSDSQRARAAGRLGLHLGTRHGRRSEALSLMRAHLDRLTDPSWRRFLAADLGKIELLAGASVTVQVADDHEAAAGPPADDPVASLNQAILTGLVAALAGDVATAEASVERGLPFTADHVAALPNGRDLLLLVSFVAQLAAGRPGPARALADAELAACRTGRDEPAGMWHAMLATAALSIGDPVLAVVEADRAIPLVAARDFVGGLHSSTQALRAVALAQLRRVEDAERQLDEIDTVWHDDPRTSAAMSHAAAWCAARRDGADVGRALADAATVMAAAGFLSAAIPIAYDAVRLHHPAPVLDVLASFARSAPSTVATVFHRHAVAAAAGDAADLLDVADALEAADMGVFAAEARLTAAARIGDARRARWLRAEANARLVQLGARSPDDPAAGGLGTRATSLTPRQIEIARLAARRRRSKEIATDLGLSVRTVDNVLGQVYRSLGVSSRDELSDALGGVDDTDE